MKALKAILKTEAVRIKQSPELLLVYGCSLVGVLYVALEVYRLFIYPLTNPYVK